MAHPLIPLIILVIVVCAAAVIGYVVYSIANDIADKTAAKMERKNVSLGKDGLKIGLKEVKDEDYLAKTQNVLVNIWNYSTWPAYKSRFWNKDTQSTQTTASAHSSGASAPSSKAHSSGAAKSRGSSRRA